MARQVIVAPSRAASSSGAARRFRAPVLAASFLAALMLAAAAPPAGAAEAAGATPAGVTPSGVTPSGVTLVTLSEQARRQLPRDRLVSDLAVEASNADARRLQDEINRRMTAALARAKEVSAVTATTTGYNVYQSHPEKAPARWQGQAGLRLESADRTALMTLVGALQAQGLTVTGLSAEVSPAAAQAVGDALTTEALHRIAQRSRSVAAALDMNFSRYRTLHIGNVVPPPSPIAPLMRAMAQAAPAAPVIEAGQATVMVSVTAEVELTPRR